MAVLIVVAIAVILIFVIIIEITQHPSARNASDQGWLLPKKTRSFVSVMVIVVMVIIRPRQNCPHRCRHRRHPHRCHHRRNHPPIPLPGMHPTKVGC